MSDWDDPMSDGSSGGTRPAVFLEASSEDKTPTPPIPLLCLGMGVVVVTIALLPLHMYLVGYLSGVIGSIVLSVAMLRDQRLQAKSDYIYLKWFKPTAATFKWIVFVGSFLHIIFLAIEKTK
jgi:hypothetical protein